MKANYREFNLVSEFRGAKTPIWSPSNKNHHVITVINTDTGRKTKFDFWGSDAHPDIETEYDLINAFYCFVSDAMSASQSYEDFCREFGYADEDAEDVYQSCEESLSNLEIIYTGDVYDLGNNLADDGYC